MKTLVLIMMIWSCSAHAETATEEKSKVVLDSPTDIKLLSWKEYTDLDSETRAYYLYNLQTALVEVEESLESHPELFSFHKFLTDLVLADARAGDHELCLFAGFMSYKRDDGLCQESTRSGCSNPREWQCNPFIFGPGVCAAGKGPQAKKGLTATCHQRSLQKYPDYNTLAGAQLADLAARYGAQWDQFVDLVNQHCSRKQDEMCRIVQRRIVRIIRAKDGNAAAVAAETRAAEAKTSAKNQSSGTGQTRVVSGGCDVNDLVEEINVPPASSAYLMSLTEARSIACDGAIDKTRIANHEKVLSRQLGKLGPKNSWKSRSFRPRLARIQSSLRACMKGHQAPGTLKGHVYDRGNGVVQIALSNGKNAVTHKIWLGRVLEMYGANLCDVEIASTLAAPTARQSGRGASNSLENADWARDKVR